MNRVLRLAFALVLMVFLMGAPALAAGPELVAQAGSGTPSSSWNLGRPPAGADASAAIKQAWNDLFRAKYDESNALCEFDYGPQGMKNVYCYLSSVFSYGRLVQLSGLKPFASGPHGAGGLELKTPYDFGRYNPQFVEWMTANLVPAEKDEQFKWITEPLYKKFFQGTARLYYLVHFRMHQDPGFFQGEVQAYQKALTEKNLDPYWFTKYWSLFPDSLYEKQFGGDFYWGNVTACAAGFWIRRSIDQTDGMFLNGLEKLLKTYDPDFISTQAKTLVQFPSPQPAPSGTAASAPKTSAQSHVAFETTDRMLQRFLEDLAAAMEGHDWERTLTLFDPANYQEQKNMGIDAPQYIAEGLGLGFADNHLIPKPGDATPWARLNGIGQVRFTQLSPPDAEGLVQVHGLVTLFDGSQKKMVLYLAKTPTGAYMMKPPVG